MPNSTVYQDGTYLSQNRTWHAEDSRWKAANVGLMLGRNGIAASTICEVGCGAGGILECLAEDYGPDVTFSGYEISPQAFELCHPKERQNLRFFLKDALDAQEAFFDVVLAMDVLEHVEDYLGFLRKLRARGTFKVFHIPLDLSVQMVLRSTPIMRARASVGHLHYFTKETALATLTHAGYRVLDSFYTSPMELPHRGWRRGVLRGPRTVLFSVNRDLTVRVLGGFSLMVLAT